MIQLNDFERQMLLYRIDNLKNLGNKEFMVAFAGVANDYDLIQKEDFEHLQDHEWCRNQFKHEYTVLKVLSKNIAETLVEEKKDNTGRQRYYDNVFFLNGKNVLLSSEWYDGKGKKADNRSGFINWLKHLVQEKYMMSLTASTIKTTTVFQCNKNIFPYLTALRTKPFMLLAGISGTGKSRIVREMAKACWKEGDEEYGKNNPRNFCMVQVKPNWHDSTELMGYVTRISGTPEYIPGPFLRFLAAAIKEPSVPYFLCLDEMNLAPVEQYFAEYLSVIESRKLNSDGTITTDPIIKPEDTQEYHDLIGKLLGDEERLKGSTLTIPQNLFVVGTVNMDETTFSFSRKVLDRAMTIEMNEVDLHGGLEKLIGNEIGYIGNSIIGDAAEGCDVYEDNRELCDQVLAYLEEVNKVLEDTPFKIAYRTRNEFLMYAVNRKQLVPESQLWQTLDEMTSMKILSRIEGDSDRTEKPLTELKKLVEEHILNAIPTPEDGTPKPTSITATKIDEMLAKLKSTSFTSYWT